MNHWAKFLLVPLWPIILCACASLPPPPDTAQLLADSRFAAASEPVSADQLFEISPEMRSYVHSREFASEVRIKGAERGLIDALYQKGELRLEYDSSLTRNAAQTFNARRGNCLSLVVMTAAFAKELGLRVSFQTVLADETWSRKGALYFASGHVNLVLSKRPPDNPSASFSELRALTIDFLPPTDVAGYHTVPIDEATVVGMYLNNRAAEMLAQGKIDDAYWWARLAVQRSPGFVTAYNTLGVIYQRHGDAQMAERAFRLALQREPENTVVMYNLVPLLATLGKGEESRLLAARLASIEPHPPFHFFNLGMKAMEQARYADAKALFAKEVARAPYYHEFHFWLAIACVRMGEASQAREQLALAMETSTTPDSRSLYSAKLAHLRAMNPVRPSAY